MFDVYLLSINVLISFCFNQIYFPFQALHDCESALSQNNGVTLKDTIPPDTLNSVNNFYNVFLTSMSDDLHTPVVLAALSDPLKTINDLLHTRKVWMIHPLSCD